MGCICCKEEFKPKFKCFKAGSGIKLACSYLVDADRPDAFSVENSELYSTATPEWDDLITKLGKKISNLQAKEQSGMSKLRKRVLEDCKTAGLRDN